MSVSHLEGAAEGVNTAPAVWTAGAPVRPRQWRHALKTGVSVFFLALAAWFLYRLFRDVDSRQLLDVLRRIPAQRISFAMLATAASYATLSMYDFLAIRHFGLALPYQRILPTAFVCYAYNFNLGSVVGAVGLRYRLYSHWGLKIGDIGRVTVYAAATSWVGYLALAGVVLTVSAAPLPDGYPSLFVSFRPLGILFLILAISYIVLCRHRESPLRIRHWRYELPEHRDALVQIGVACVQWSLASLVLYLLFPADLGLGYVHVLQVHLIAAIAGLLVHVPAGLGVIEGVFMLMLGETVPRETVLGTLIAFRAVYYLIPLAVATVCLASLELKQASTSRARPRV